MRNGTLKRHRYADYLNVGTETEPAWALMGVGFKVLDENPGTQSETVRYICDSGSSTETTGYQTEFPFEADQIIEQQAITALYTIARNHLTGEDAEREYIRVELWKPGDGQNEFAARKFRVAAEISAFSGETKMSIAGTLKAVGDPVLGTFDTAERVFEKPTISLSLDFSFDSSPVLGAAKAADLESLTDQKVGTQHYVSGTINQCVGLEDDAAYVFVMKAMATGVPDVDITARCGDKVTRAQNGIIYMWYTASENWMASPIVVTATGSGADPVTQTIRLQNVLRGFPDTYIILDAAAKYGASANPAALGLFEEDGTSYKPSADTSVHAGKRYFVIAAPIIRANILGDEVILGIPAEELQANIAINDSAITGTLNHVSGWYEYSDTETEQTGYFIALNIYAPPGAVIEGGESCTHAQDDIFIFRVTDNSDPISITYTRP